MLGIPTLPSCERLPSEVVVVDNGRRLDRAEFERYPLPLTIITPPYNLGVAESWNTIGRLCRPGDIVLSNDDVILNPRAFNIVDDPAAMVFGYGFAFFLIREEAWKTVGPFDRAFWPVLEDTRTAKIDDTDLLMIDTCHHYEHLQAELAASGMRARKFLVFHDTAIYGSTGDNGGLGLRPAIDEFMAANPVWELWREYTNCHGLIVLRRSG